MKPPLGYVEVVRRKAERMARARRRAPLGWRHLSSVGVLGWLFIIPVVLGAFAGRLVARTWHTPGATLIGLGLGLAAGAYVAFRHVQTSLRQDDDSPSDAEQGASDAGPSEPSKLDESPKERSE